MRHLFSVIVFIFISYSAQADVRDLIEFRTDIAPESTLTLSIRNWSPSEKALITELFQSLENKAPGLLARAAQPGKIMLYRATSSPSHPSGGWVKRRHESSFLFTDVFFSYAEKGPRGYDYISSLFIHEIAHLADPVDQIGRSDEWSKLIEPRLLSVSQALATKGLTVRQAMFKRLDADAAVFGFPSIYAAISRHEALAEFVAARYFGKPIPEDIEKFLAERMFEKPDPEAGKVAKIYRRAYIHFRKKQFKQAIYAFDEAIEISPEFSQGIYLRGFAHMNAKKYKLAIKDYTEALKLVPKDDLQAVRELLEARVWVREHTADWQGVITDYTKLIEQNNKRASYYSGRGTAYLKMKTSYKAIKDFQRALGLNPKNSIEINRLLNRAEMLLPQED